ncbi:MAG: response regulator transcription factor [Deltaproteobacteria bacterium]|nr:response regulator transcription factor [Deltaproteobacteria bacterium]
MDKADLKVLVVDDSRAILKFVQACLIKDGPYLVSLAPDGTTALRMIENALPDILITDWEMPNMNGIDLCRKVRTMPMGEFVYIIILTARTDRKDTLFGLDAGADDYVIKPFDQGELLARVRAGVRVLRSQKALQKTNDELTAAFHQIKTLKGLLPICMDCKKIRNDQAYWLEIEDYVRTYTDMEFSHGLCPACEARRMEEIKAYGEKH